VKARFLRGLEPADIEEFGFDDANDTANVPRLIASLPECDREAYRNARRAHVKRMTGRDDITWRQYLDGESQS
jgi:hypothetical protein